MPLLAAFPVVILHGLGERVWTLTLFLSYLRWYGFNNVVAPHWPANSCTLDQCLDSLDATLSQSLNKSEPIFVVGNSMGGVMALHLHNRGWQIEKAIAIAAPLHGAWMFRWLESMLPHTLFAYFDRPGYAYLRGEQSFAEPPHAYRTLSFGPGFDSHVFESEAIVNASRHTRFVLGTHFSICFDPRVWTAIAQELVDVPSVKTEL